MGLVNKKRGVIMLDLETIGYFLYMSEQEQKEKAARENRSTENYPSSKDEESDQKTNR